jgi:hypothetical protein
MIKWCWRLNKSLRIWNRGRSVDVASDLEDGEFGRSR